MRDEVLALMESRGVTVEDIASIVYTIQHVYYENLLPEECINSVMEVIGKREVQQAVLTGIALDILAEKGELPSPLQEIIARDDPLYGVDEVMALSIINVYGSIGLTNFGYLDKLKPGIIAALQNRHENGSIHTFLDDLVAAIAAAAAARLAHNQERP